MADENKWTVRQYNTVAGNVAVSDTNFVTEADAKAFAQTSTAVKTLMLTAEQMAKMDEYINGVLARVKK